MQSSFFLKKKLFKDLFHFFYKHLQIILLFNLEPLLNRSAAVLSMSDDKSGNYLTCSREKGTISIFACVIAFRNMLFQGAKNYTGFLLSLPVVFSWCIGESAVHDSSPFGAQEAVINCPKKSHANVSLCLFMNMTV